MCTVSAPYVVATFKAAFLGVVSCRQLIFPRSTVFSRCRSSDGFEGFSNGHCNAGDGLDNRGEGVHDLGEVEGKIRCVPPRRFALVSRSSVIRLRRVAAVLYLN